MLPNRFEARASRTHHPRWRWRIAGSGGPEDNTRSLVGQYLSWESTTFATWGSRVRIPSAPPFHFLGRLPERGAAAGRCDLLGRRCMQSRQGILYLAATDLANHLACGALTALDAAVARGERGAPRRFGARLHLPRERGREHERGYL